jgi:hypothetical protein
VPRHAVRARAILVLLPPPAPARAQRVELLVPWAELEARAARDSLDPAAQYDAALGRFSTQVNVVRRQLAGLPQ